MVSDARKDVNPVAPRLTSIIDRVATCLIASLKDLLEQSAIKLLIVLTHSSLWCITVDSKDAESSQFQLWCRPARSMVLRSAPESWATMAMLRVGVSQAAYDTRHTCLSRFKHTSLQWDLQT